MKYVKKAFIFLVMILVLSCSANVSYESLKNEATKIQASIQELASLEAKNDPSAESKKAELTKSITEFSTKITKANLSAEQSTNLRAMVVTQTKKAETLPVEPSLYDNFSLEADGFINEARAFLEITDQAELRDRVKDFKIRGKAFNDKILASALTPEEQKSIIDYLHENLKNIK